MQIKCKAEFTAPAFQLAGTGVRPASPTELSALIRAEQGERAECMCVGTFYGGFSTEYKKIKLDFSAKCRMP